jgi:hypothetical protein
LPARPSGGVDMNTVRRHYGGLESKAGMSGDSAAHQKDAGRDGVVGDGPSRRNRHLRPSGVASLVRMLQEASVQFPLWVGREEHGGHDDGHGLARGGSYRRR